MVHVWICPPEKLSASIRYCKERAVKSTSTSGSGDCFALALLADYVEISLAKVVFCIIICLDTKGN